MNSSSLSRRCALAAMLLLAGCKPTSVSKVKDDTSGAGAAGGNCATEQTVQGREVGPDLGADPLGAAPAITDKNPPTDAPSATECAAPNADGPRVQDFKKNDLYQASAPRAQALALAEGDTKPPGEGAGQPDADPGASGAPGATGVPGTSGAPGATGAAASTGAGDTSGDACDTEKKVDVKILYGKDAGTLPGCSDPSFTAWLKDLAKKEAQRTGKSSEFADKLSEPGAATDMQRTSTAQAPADTRESYENGVYALLKDVQSITNKGGSNLVDDLMSLLGEVDPTHIELPKVGETTNPKDTDVLGYNAEIDELAGNFAQLENLESLFAGGPSGNRPGEGIALTDKLPGGATESKGGDYKSFEVGNPRFKLAFSAGFGAQYGADNSFGRGGSDPDLRPTGGEEVDGNTRSLKDQRDPFKTEKFKGLSVGGGPAVDVTVFGKEFKNVLKGYVKGQAFGNDVTKNGLELGFQVFGATLWKKNYLNCNKPKPGEAENGCKDPDAAKPTNKLQQKLAWLGRTARGLYNFTVGPVPMDAEWTAAPYVGYSWNIGVEMDAKAVSAKLVAGFYPRGKAAVSLAGGFSFVGQRAGVGGRLTLLNIGPTGQVGASALIEEAGFKFCPFVKSTLESEFLGGNLFAYAQVWYVFGSKYWELNLYSWTGVTDTKTLFEVTPDSCKNVQAKAVADVADVSPDAKKTRIISQYNSDYCIDQDTVNREHVYVHPCHNEPNQKFTFEPGSDPKIGKIKSGDGRCLDMNYTKKSGNGFELYLGDCNSGANQSFFFRDDGTITDLLKAYCVDFDIGRGDGGGYKLYSHPCHTESNQKWRRETL